MAAAEDVRLANVVRPSSVMNPSSPVRVQGQVRADLDPESVVDQLWGACYHRLLLPNQALDHHFADALVTNLFRGVGAS